MLQFRNRQFLVLAFTAFAMLNSYAQEAEPKEDIGRNRLSFLMAYGIIPEHTTVDDATSNYLFVVPAIGMNYDFLFTPKFGLGLHTDVILQKFEVQELKDDLEVERMFPVTVNLMASYRPNDKWTVLAGGGVELEKNKSYNMVALGLDYGIELNESWEVGFSFMFEHRIQAYNSFLFGVGIYQSIQKSQSRVLLKISHSINSFHFFN